MANNAEIERVAAQWLACREAGWSDAEQAQFQAWRDADIAHRIAWIRLDTGWQRAARLKALGAGLPPGQVPPVGAWPELHAEADAAAAAPTFDARSNLREVVFRPRARPRQPRMLRWSAAFAMLLLAAGFAGWWRYGSVERASYATAIGEMRTVALADGSTVQLSSGSRVDVAYSRGQRHLQLEQGEAFFQVAHQASRPFTVEADGRKVVAVGTRFSVRRNGDDLRVAVAEGKVRLEDDAHPDSVPTLLPAGMVANAGTDGVRVHSSSANDMAALLSWREGLLVFRSTPLADAVAEFNRYNTHKLVLDDPKIADIPVGGSFRWTNTEAFVRVLEQGFGLQAERRGDRTHLRAQ